MLSLAILGGLALSTGVVNASPLPQAHNAPQYSWVNFDGQWLCRSWDGSSLAQTVIVPGMKESAAAGHTVWDYDPVGGRAYGMTGSATTRCTTHWRIDSSLRLLSGDSAWTPNPAGAWPVASDLLAFVQPLAHLHAPRVRALTPVVKHRATMAPVSRPNVTNAPRGTTGHSTGGTTRRTTGGSTGGSSGGSSRGSGGYNPWSPVPGHPTYGMGDFAGDPYSSSFGVCTWYAWYRHRSEPLASFGSAVNWVAAARAHGIGVGSQPVAGATVVFSPGVEGAGGGGHAAHVEAVLGGGWFIISEMNFYWNGGGWGRVDFRYAYVRSGVSFIY